MSALKHFVLAAIYVFITGHNFVLEECNISNASEIYLILVLLLLLIINSQVKNGMSPYMSSNCNSTPNKKVQLLQ